MIANSARRVNEQTDPKVNARIRRETQRRLEYYIAHPDQIEHRLRELDDEWDVERMLGTLSSGMSLFGLLWGVAIRRRWLIVPVVVQGFYLQHQVQGWCPPLPMLRGLGFRTRDEINIERYALRAIRGDFKGMTGPNSAGRKPDAEKLVRKMS